MNLSYILEKFGKMLRIGRSPIQTPLDARPALGTKLRYEAPGDLRLETRIM